MNDDQAVMRAANAVQAYHDWQEQTEGESRRILAEQRRARMELAALMPDGNRPTDPFDLERVEILEARMEELKRELLRYRKAHPQPRTADDILEKHTGGDHRHWQRLVDATLEEVARRREAAGLPPIGHAEKVA